MKHIGLYFGTFNPIHVGHMIIANHIVENTDLDEVWLVITPHSPHKLKSNLLNQYHRLEMAFLATKDYDKLRVSDIEFGLPQPSYTSDTLSYISDKYPKNKFSIIMGEDNLRCFHKWKNYQAILEYHHIYVYPRPNIVTHGDSLRTFKNNNITKVDAPMMDISSSYIRNLIRKGLSPRAVLPEPVWVYVDEMNFYATLPPHKLINKTNEDSSIRCR